MEEMDQIPKVSNKLFQGKISYDFILYHLISFTKGTVSQDLISSKSQENN